MTPLFPARRAAEEFDRVLSGSAAPSVADRYTVLLGTVEVLRRQPEVVPRAEFASDLRARLLTAAQTDLSAAPGAPRRLAVAPTRRATPRNRHLGAVAAGLVILGGGTAVAATSAGALPGDPLYPVKRGLEEVGTAMHTSDAGKGDALLDHAATRLQEVRDLQSDATPDPALLAATVDSFRESADDGSDRLFTAYQAGGDTDLVTTVRAFTGEQMSVLAVLAAAAEDPEVTELLRDATDTVAAIDQQARVLCSVCGPRRTLEVPGGLAATSGDATLANLLERPVVQVRADLAALEASRRERLRQAASTAEDRAGDLPAPGAGDGAPGPAVPVDGDTVTSLVTGDGRSVPAPARGAGSATEDLVDGVTSDVEAVTGKPDGVIGGVTGGATGTLPGQSRAEDLLDDLVDGTTDPLDGATDDLLP